MVSTTPTTDTTTLVQIEDRLAVTASRWLPGKPADRLHAHINLAVLADVVTALVGEHTAVLAGRLRAVESEAAYLERERDHALAALDRDRELADTYGPVGLAVAA